MTQEKSRIFTIGYEGATVEQLIDTLANMGVEVLADVRELPLSRKKGLSKNALAGLLAQRGIEYRHYRQLGDPKPGRDAAKSGDYKTFVKVFSEHLGKAETKDTVEELLGVARQKVTCMMCFERCATHCHRSMISDLAVEAGFEVLNLVADRPEKYLENGLKIPRHSIGQSLPAAE